MAVLRFENISKGFPGVQALDDISLEARSGEVLVLQGENGAGKSTLLKVLNGLYQADSGEIYLDDQKLEFKDTGESTKAGIVMVYQEMTLFPDITVAENVFLNYEKNVPNAINKFGLIDQKAMNEQFRLVAQKYGIHIDPTAMVRDLTITEQQLVEIIKAVVRKPKVLVLDEPTSALTMHEVDILHGIVEQLKKEDIIIIFISHRMEEVFKFGDRIAVMKDGKLVKVMPKEGTTEGDIIKYMVGREIKEVFPPKCEIEENNIIFSVEHLNINKKVSDITFDVKKGEIVGIASLQGQGQTEVFRALAGVMSYRSGCVKIDGEPIKISSVKKAIDHGIIYIPEDRKAQGAFQNLTVKENIAASSMNKRQTAGFIDLKKEKEVVSKYIQEFGIKTPTAEQRVGNLSGGNQQKVVLGRCCAIKPRIMLFNEPTRGIDVDSKKDIYTLMRKYASEGTAVVMYSSDMLEIIGLCDKVLAMYEGSITGVYRGEDLTEEKLMCGIVGCTGE